MIKIKSYFYLIFFIGFTSNVFAGDITNPIPDPASGLSGGNWAQTTLFLQQLSANINWMVAMGVIFALAMTIIHLFTNHHENILKAVLKTFAGLFVLKASIYLITLAVK